MSKRPLADELDNTKRESKRTIYDRQSKKRANLLIKQCLLEGEYFQNIREVDNPDDDKIWENLSFINNGLKIKKSNIEGAGNGVFTTKKIKEGDIITEYSGIIKHNSDLVPGDNVNYLLAISKEMFIDASDMTPETGKPAGGYLNSIRPKVIDTSDTSEMKKDHDKSSNSDSEQNTYYAMTIKSLQSKCIARTNTYSSYFNDNKKPKPTNRMWIVAIRDIEENTELLCNYGTDYWVKSDMKCF